jgi:hypothetical protein
MAVAFFPDAIQKQERGPHGHRFIPLIRDDKEELVHGLGIVLLRGRVFVPAELVFETTSFSPSVAVGVSDIFPTAFLSSIGVES